MPRLEASTDAIKWATHVCTLGDTEPLTLDAVQLAWESRSVIEGSPIDLTYVGLEVCRLLKLPADASVTLQHVRQALAQLVERQAQIIQQAMERAPAATSHSPDECAATILALCPIDMQEQMEVARETWHFAGEAMPDAEILASVLIANRQSLHAGDITELQPRTAIARHYGQTPPAVNGSVPTTCPAVETIVIRDEMLGERKIEVALCGHSFVPKRRGQKFGCAHCGTIAHQHKIYLLEVLEAQKRGQDGGSTVRKPAAFDPAQCTCGQEVGILVGAV